MAEKEYIEREAALAFQNEVEPLLCRNVVTHVIMSATKDADMVKYLQSIPAADVRSVVMCKDCVHSDKWYKDRLICYLWNEHDGNSVFEDGFCNYGKKRDES